SFVAPPPKNRSRLSLGLVFPAHRIHTMPLASPFNFLPQRHAIAFCHATRWQILRADERNDAISREIRKAPGFASLCRFGRESLPPLVAGDDNQSRIRAHRRLPAW